MKKFGLAALAFVGLGGSVFADTIWVGSAGSLNTVPSTSSFVGSMASFPVTNSPNTQIPFWNNPSSDTINGDNARTNVGDILAGVSTGTNLIGSNLSGTPAVNGTATTINGSYFAFTTNDNTGGGGDPVTSTTSTTGGTTSSTPSLEYSFTSAATAYNIAILFADSGQNVAGPAGTTFGYYNGSLGTGIFLHQIGGNIANNTSGTPTTLASNDTIQPVSGSVYGFYATVCYQVTAGACTESVTYTTGAGNYSSNITSGSVLLGALGWNHFALFELSSGEEVLGFEDSPWALANSNATEGIGDFNDVVVGLNPLGAPPSVPEPGTIAIMGLGLAVLGSLGRKRFAKK
jgi:hypothetical protein